jgi:hypothetical protein
VDGLDGGLDLVRPRLVPAQTPSYEILPLGDEVVVPAFAVLLGQRHEHALAVLPRRPAGLDEEHQGEQARGLGLVRHQVGQQPAEADRLGAQVGRALVEDQVDDGEDPAQPVREVGVAGHAVRDPGVADLRLGADQALRHGRLGDEEGAGDLGCGEAAEQAQGQGDPGLRREGGMAAGEDQTEAFVAHGALLGRRVRGVQEGGFGVPAVPLGLAAQPVDRAVAGGGDDPAGRARRHSGLRPAPDGRGEGVLDRFLGEVDVAEEADEDGDGPAVLGAEDGLDVDGRRHQSSAWCMNGRTSMAKVVALAAFLPHSRAASRSGALMRQMPPRYSLPSAYGPSVIRTSPSPGRSTVAVSGPCRPPAKTQAPASRSSAWKVSRLRTISAMASGPGGVPSVGVITLSR